ncbi:FAD-binding oxidoreductase [Paracoccus benzoatiresistens]|uniref:Pyridoxamine 5'-phosphate oxidase family protein n=1 Tax=Paracoccus benzoatiresistens TaxID=2997341 RepID=A0ABT4JB84_9RHOB|nr:pyridoxamine 5'-phosphate oxidase family protein [Paracoccus sp. EF6]MCZ0964149.1 pyridoxamine 5'-phosphate oxidase family protein [Paracoccus sp. EF6]
MTAASPFHPGELAAQRLAGTTDIAAAGGAFIRTAMPDQHRTFFAGLPFLIVAGGQNDGQTWVSVLEGPEGFVSSPDAEHLSIGRMLAQDDPLAASLTDGGPVGLLGIDLATRRRNRLNGTLTATPQGYELRVDQSFGNCPQYIHARNWHRVAGHSAQAARISDRLEAAQTARIAAADTIFIGSGSLSEGHGYDASHRGGAPGFVRVTDDGSLLVPDYPGNNFFNTIGNLMRNPRVGVLIVDFTSGSLLHVSGRARIDWNPKDSHDPAARRMIHVAVDKVVDRPFALSLRWRPSGRSLRLKVVDKVEESAGIVSFHLTSADGTPLGRFQAGQHLPICLDIPGEPAQVERSYSLSGSPAASRWRISVKREDHGIASGFLHDTVRIGDVIEAQPPQGEFTLPPGDRPLVLVSAGVGITPLLSMLHALIAEQPRRRVTFVHVARNGRDHAFAVELNDLVAKGGHALRQVHYSAPEDGDDIRIFDRSGRIGATDLVSLPSAHDADFLLCGPAGFMADIRANLQAGGVAANRIYFETFGPSERVASVNPA